MTPQETEQVAALRMHVAHLVNALKGARADLDLPDDNPSIRSIDAALDQSEPAVKDLLAEADRDAQLVATRQQLAETTARLAQVEGAARGCPHCDGCEGDIGECGVDRLAKALT